jgi:hypothetical protein
MADRPILFSGPMVRAILDGTKTQTRRVLKPQIETFDVAPGRSCAIEIAWDVDDGKGRIWKGSYPAGATEFGWKKGTGVLTTQTVPYAPGDRLWVRETFVVECCQETGWYEPPHDDGRPLQVTECSYWGRYWAQPHYRATDKAPDLDIGDDEPGVEWRPSLHMPRWASRLTLTVTDVRVQRIQDISEEDAVAEGVDAISMADVKRQSAWSRRHDFAQLWDSINGKREGANWDANPWVVAVSFAAEKRNIDADTDPAYTARLIEATRVRVQAFKDGIPPTAQEKVAIPKSRREMAAEKTGVVPRKISPPAPPGARLVPSNAGKSRTGYLNAAGEIVLFETPPPRVTR